MSGTRQKTTASEAAVATRATKVDKKVAVTNPAVATDVASFTYHMNRPVTIDIISVIPITSFFQSCYLKLDLAVDGGNAVPTNKNVDAFEPNAYFPVSTHGSTLMGHILTANYRVQF